MFYFTIYFLSEYSYEMYFIRNNNLMLFLYLLSSIHRIVLLFVITDFIDNIKY